VELERSYKFERGPGKWFGDSAGPGDCDFDIQYCNRVPHCLSFKKNLKIYHVQLGEWLTGTLTSLEGARHILEAYFRLGLDDEVDDFLMHNIRHFVAVPRVIHPRQKGNSGPRTKGPCGTPLTHDEIFGYAVRRTPPWSLVTLEQLQAWAPMSEPGIPLTPPPAPAAAAVLASTAGAASTALASSLTSSSPPHSDVTMIQVEPESW